MELTAQELVTLYNALAVSVAAIQALQQKIQRAIQETTIPPEETKNADQS